MAMRWLRLCLMAGGLALVLASSVWVEANAFGIGGSLWRPCAQFGFSVPWSCMDRGLPGVEASQGRGAGACPQRDPAAGHRKGHGRAF